MFNKLLKASLLLFLLFVLGGCLGDQSWCITTDPDAYSVGGTIKNTINTPFNVNANGSDPSNKDLKPGGWVYTGVGVTAGETINVSAFGSMLLTVPYGLTSDSRGSMNQSYLEAAVNQSDTSSYFDNGGLGTQWVIKANNPNPTLLTDTVSGSAYVFVPGQNVYVTTKDCTTGDFTSETPSKWTWSKWNTTAVRCSSRGTRNFTVNEPYCKAVKCCRSDSVTCFRTEQWQCSYVIISSQSNIVDVCSTAQNNYNCESNSTETGQCYNTSGYNRQSGWCGGRHKFRGITVSDDQPSCSLNSSSTNVTEPVLNSCGNVDTCWNIAGYKMYAFNANASCPGSPSCIHLNNSGYSSGGKQFQAQGGPMYLKIIDPSANPGGQTVDVSGMQSQVSANEQTIAGLEITNDSLYDSLYQVVGSVISNDQVAVNDGLLTKINNYNSSKSAFAPISTFQQQSETYQNGNIDASLVMRDINSQFSSLIDRMSSLPAYIAGGEAADNADDLWPVISSLVSVVKDLQTLVASLSDQGASDNTSPTKNEINTYKSNATSMLASLSTDLLNAQSTHEMIVQNENQIDSLSSSNDSLNNQIISATNSGPNDALGGYTAYVRSDPIIAQNGQYLEVVIADGNPNYSDTILTKLGPISANVKSVTVDNNGDLWARIVDADGSYSENIGSYSVNIGRVTSGSGFGNIFTLIVNQIINHVNSFTKTMYQNMTCTAPGANTDSCTDYLQLVRIALMLYVLVYGLMYVTGLVHDSAYDLTMRLIKIGIIATLMSPNSFDFFNDTVFKGFLSLTNTLISAATGAPIDNPFAFLEQSMAVLILDPNTYLKLISLIFMYLIGFVIFILLIYGIFKYVSAVFHAMKTYVMAYVGLAICFVLAPIFIPFSLFKRTNHLFENWYIAMFRFTMEPVLLIIGLVMLNAMLLNILQEIFNFSACFKCLIPIKFAIPGVPTIPSASLYCIPGFAPWGADNVGSGVGLELILSIPLVFTFCIVTRIMDIYSRSFAREISVAIFGDGGATFLRSKAYQPLETNPFRDFSDGYTKMKNTYLQSQYAPRQ